MENPSMVESLYMFYRSGKSVRIWKSFATAKVYIHRNINRRFEISKGCRRMSTTQTVELNRVEDSIRKVLIEFCNDYNRRHDSSSGSHLELRITGGWVRDKLLGMESNDLDIAVNSLSGEEFASMLLRYLHDTHPDLDLMGIHTIKKNPDKSKHLETCTTRLFGLDIDFVNLRSEKYTSDSRIPIIECGTPQEDALRRDATLNALFYNISTGKIEDFTGRGLMDLKEGILRTPLSPWQTFLDDPLRVLRLIRFASRFNFKVEQETLKAMAADEIKSALIHKISRERVGVEMEKTLTSAKPQYGLELICFVGLTRSIFDIAAPQGEVQKLNSPDVIEQCDAIYNDLETHIPKFTLLTQAFDKVLKSSGHTAFNEAYWQVQNDKLSRKRFFLACVLLPFSSFSLTLNAGSTSGIHVPEVIVKQGLRFGRADSHSVSLIVKESQLSHETLTQMIEDTSGVMRSSLAIYIRKFGDNFNLNIVCNCFNDILRSVGDVRVNTQQPPTPDNSGLAPLGSLMSDSIESTIKYHIERYDRLLRLVNSLQLQNAHKIKPLVDGKTLSNRLSLKPGPWMSKVNLEIITWQFDNPTASEEDCITYARSIVHNFI